ncbi:CapA family protein [Helicobacter fennelliae]|uniref:CapA family protein n=1 Tax=Helicobacter fennelliae TaxID=215 RepID=UPI0021AD1D5E|nr:CapA family protein [Helicobacter fennelliae]
MQENTSANVTKTNLKTKSTKPIQTHSSHQKPQTLSIIMAGDALLHTNVYKDAQIAPTTSQLDSSVLDSKIDSKLDSAKKTSESKIPESKTSKTFAPDSHIMDSHISDFSTIESDLSIRYDFDKMFVCIAPIIKHYDLTFYNQETILVGKELGLSSYPMFNSPQEFGDTMLKLGFNLISANNHTLNKGERGVVSMLEYWHKQQTKYLELYIAGSYQSFEDRNTPKIFEKNGITYAMLAYTYGINGIMLPLGKEYLVNVYTKQMLQSDIESIRPKVDLLIVSMHWGIEYEFAPSEEQKNIAKMLASLGVDLIIGNHPHVIQPIEWIDHTLVVYSLGNFISGQKGTNKRIGILASVKVEKKHGASNFISQELI